MHLSTSSVLPRESRLPTHRICRICIIYPCNHYTIVVYKSATPSVIVSLRGAW
ncbi:hypothetical protein DIRU0_E30834 [Diutina rugosa]